MFANIPFGDKSILFMSNTPPIIKDLLMCPVKLYIFTIKIYKNSSCNIRSKKIHMSSLVNNIYTYIIYGHANGSSSREISYSSVCCFLASITFCMTRSYRLSSSSSGVSLSSGLSLTSCRLSSSFR